MWRPEFQVLHHNKLFVFIWKLFFLFITTMLPYISFLSSAGVWHNHIFYISLLCVPTCFHMRIPKPCLSVRTPRKEIADISPTLVIDTSMERSSRVLQHGNQKIWFYKKKNWLNVSAIMFCKQFLACAAFFNTPSGMHRRPFEGRHLVLHFGCGW